MKDKRLPPHQLELGSCRGPAWAWLAVFGLTVLFALLVFRAVLPADAVLFTTDDNLGFISLLERRLPRGLLEAPWFDGILAGMPEARHQPALTELLLLLLPPRLFANWHHAIALVLAGFLLYAFLRLKGVGWLPCLLGVLCAFWVGSNFTLVYAGHMRKFGTLVFAAAALLLAELSARNRFRLRWAVPAGAAFAFMMLEQQDVGFFFALFWGGYLLFVCLSRCGNMRRAVPFLAVALAVCGLVAGPALLEARRVNVREQEQSDPVEKWNFATQWSWPPEESIDFIAPGYMGWRTGEPAGPYWGRMGRSSEWETTRSGFFNFKLENQYLGAIPVVFAVFAVFAAVALSSAGAGTAFEPPLRREIFFWAAAAVLALLLSFGRYFPLYSLFFRLPAVNDIRNPNKLLQVFQVALAMLAAFGFEAALRFGRRNGESGGAAKRAAPQILTAFWVFLAIVLFAAIVLLLSAGAATLGEKAEAARYSAMGWGEAGKVIAANKSKALWHAAVMLLAAAAFFGFVFFRAPGRRRLLKAVAIALVAVVAADALWLSRHYVKTMSVSEFKENEVLRILKGSAPERRTALVTKQGFYNYWLTYMFPYHDIKAFDFAQMPRMPEDYRRFLAALWNSAVPLRLWRLCAVEHVLAPREAWDEIQKFPALKDAFEPVLEYDAASVPSGGIAVLPAAAGRRAGHAVLRLKAAAPRFAVIGAWREAPDEEALKLLADESVPLFDTVFVAPGHGQGLPPLDHGGPAGRATLVEYRPGLVRLRVEAERPSLLRFSEKFDPHWRALVNGEPAQVRRADYIFQAVFVQPGTSEVLLRYAAPKLFFWIQLAGLLLCVPAAGLIAVERLRRGCATAAGPAAAAEKAPR